MPTQEEKEAAKLQKLRAKAAELGVEFAPDTSFEDLTEMVKEAKKAHASKKATPAVFTVLNSSGSPVRDYSVAIHGNDAGKLAAEYAKKIGGSVR